MPKSYMTQKEIDRIYNGMSKDEVANFKLSIVATPTSKLEEMETSLKAQFAAASDKKQQTVLEQKAEIVAAQISYNKSR